MSNEKQLKERLDKLLNHENTIQMLERSCGGDKAMAKRVRESVKSLLYLQPRIAVKAAENFREFLALVMRFAGLDLDFSTDMQIVAAKPGAKNSFYAYYTADALRKVYHRSPRIKVKAPVVVHQNDVFSFRRVIGENGTEPELEHVPELEDDPGPPRLGYVSYSVDGEWDIAVVTKGEFSIAMGASRDKSIWERNPVAMWKKTMIRRLDKILPIHDVMGTVQQLPEDADMEGEADGFKSAPVEDIGEALKDLAEDGGEEEEKPAKKRGRPKKEEAKKKPAQKPKKPKLKEIPPEEEEEEVDEEEAAPAPEEDDDPINTNFGFDDE